MSVLDKNVIDSIGTNIETGSVILIISDHLGWAEETQSHLLALQEKLNTYIQFIESSEIYSAFPSAVGKKLVVDIYFKFPPGDECRHSFLTFSEFWKVLVWVFLSQILIPNCVLENHVRLF